jgi:hypothetical protein
METKALIDPHTGHRWVKKPPFRTEWIRRIWRHGGGLNVTIPPELVSRFNLSGGEYMLLRAEKDRITLVPAIFHAGEGERRK